MEFVSTDRSRDAEFTRGLQQYNRQVLENNKDIAARIDESQDQLDKDLANAQEVADLANLKTAGALGGVGAGVLEKGARAKTEYGKFKIAKATAQQAAERLAARGGAVEVPVTAAEELAGPGGRFTGITNLLGDPRAERQAEAAFQEEQAGIRQVYRSGARPTSPTRERPQRFTEQEQREFRQGIEERGAAREAAAAEQTAAPAAERIAASGAEVTEEAAQVAAGGVGKVLGKLAGGVARGAGVAGAALSAGTAIEGLMEGKKFEWDKQGAEIGGALLDILGTGAEFLGPVGAAVGVGLQLAGTALSTVGTVKEGLDTEPEQAEAEEKAKELQAKTQSDLEAERKQVISRVTQAGAGGAAVAREQQ
jgi:hypothetical protein